MVVVVHARREPSETFSDAEAERWRDVPVAVAVDLASQEQIDPAIRPINPPGRQPKLFGRAVTAKCAPPDFGAVLHAIAQVGPGDVLVIDAGGQSETAMIGEIVGGNLRARGGVGLVCDGPVRDVAMLAGWSDFSVFTRSVTPRGPSSATEGVVNGAVQIGGRLVSPGDLILGDDDGLVALSRRTVRDRIADAEAKLALEQQWISALADGRAAAEVFGIGAPDLVERD